MCRPPFTASDPMKVYNIILRGFDFVEIPRHVNRYAIFILLKRLSHESSPAGSTICPRRHCLNFSIDNSDLPATNWKRYLFVKI
jgi:hypothetical protein